MKYPINLHFLPGFLGHPSDWQQFQKDFQPYSCFFYSIEDFCSLSHKKKNAFEGWAAQLNASVFKVDSSSRYAEIGARPKNILIGYSLGGRLALHCLMDELSSWDAAIIISANPGLMDAAEKSSRLQNDEQWANRFLTEDWDSLIKAWNAQGVFSNQKNYLNREEKDYDRKKIAKILIDFSLGKQEDLREKIKKIGIPVLWLAGELDKKFATVAQHMSEKNCCIRSCVLANIGHRVPWENPAQFTQKCLEFILKSSSN